MTITAFKNLDVVRSFRLRFWIYQAERARDDLRTSDDEAESENDMHGDGLAIPRR